MDVQILLHWLQTVPLSIFVHPCLIFFGPRRARYRLYRSSARYPDVLRSRDQDTSFFFFFFSPSHPPLCQSRGSKDTSPLLFLRRLLHIFRRPPRLSDSGGRRLVREAGVGFRLLCR